MARERRPGAKRSEAAAQRGSAKKEQRRRLNRAIQALGGGPRGRLHQPAPAAARWRQHGAAPGRHRRAPSPRTRCPPGAGRGAGPGAGPRHGRLQRGREAAAAAAPRPAAALAAGPGAERAGARPAAAAAGARGRLLGALPAARRPLAAAGVQDLPDRRLPGGAGADPRLAHPLLREVPCHENAVWCRFIKSSDIPGGQNFRDGRSYSTPERRTRWAPLMAEN